MEACENIFLLFTLAKLVTMLPCFLFDIIMDNNLSLTLMLNKHMLRLYEQSMFDLRHMGIQYIHIPMGNMYGSNETLLFKTYLKKIVIAIIFFTFNCEKLSPLGCSLCTQ